MFEGETDGCRMMKKRVSIIVYGMLWLIVFFVLSCAARSENVDFGKISIGELEPFNDKWIYQNGTENEAVELPVNLDENETSEFVLTRLLPEQIKAGEHLFTSTCHTELQVYVDGQMIYHYGSNDKMFFINPGNALHSIPLLTEYAGKEIRLIYQSKIPRYRGVIDAVQIGDRTSFLMSYLKANLFSVLTCTLTLGLAMFLFIIWLAIRKIVKQNGLLYLSLFCFNMFMWSAGETYLPQFFWGHTLTISILTFEALLLLPIPLLLLLKEHISPLVQKAAKGFLTSTVLIFFLCNLLFAGKVMDLAESLWITHLNLLLGTTAVLTAILSGNRERRALSGGIEGRTNLSTLGFLFMAVSIVLSMINYYVSVTSDNYNIVKIGLIIYVLTFSIDSVQNGFKMALLGEKAAKFENLAYKDMLTGVWNRTAYKEEMQKLDEDPELRASTAVVIIDINNLKKINDAMGHAVGDRYILSNVELIRKHFEDIGKIFRIGGDEFVVLITQDDDEKFRWKLYQMEKDVNSEGISNFAFGYAYFEDSDVSIQNTAKRADVLMYQKKLKQKEKS